MTTHRILALLPLVLAAGVTACAHGTQPKDFRPATGPAGASVWLLAHADRRERTGELYAVDEAGVLVRSTQLLRVRWEHLERMDVVGLGGGYDVGRTAPDSAHRARLALVSRFPQGLGGELLQRVLATLGQEAVLEHGAPRRESRDLDALAEAAARAAERFADRRAAIAAGYRRIGTDFPAMGEHWLHTGALLHATVDPSRPTMLTYVTVAGRPVLVGTGFVMSTRGDEVPEDVPGWPAEWHEHSGLVADESGAHGDDAAHAHHATTDPARTRVWVLHVWTGAENPAGRYQADNWALPFVRAGIGAAVPVDERAGRALSLAVGGDAFLRALLTDGGVRREANAGVVDALIDSARVTAAAVATRARADGVADAAALATLREAWDRLSQRLVRATRPEAMRFLASGH